MPSVKAKQCSSSLLSSEDNTSTSRSGGPSTSTVNTLTFEVAPPSATATLTTETLTKLKTSLNISPCTSSTDSNSEFTTVTDTTSVFTTLSTIVSGGPTTRPLSTISTRSIMPVVTNQAYVDTVTRHHNAHRANHSAPAITWNAMLADTARTISLSCIYVHNTSVNGGGYGQNIGAGFLATSMGQFISEALYNREVNDYTYYDGKEPPLTANDVGKWGHFTQIVWISSISVGCYTNDCSVTGLLNANFTSYFTVCNYFPPGNIGGAFSANVSPGTGAGTIDAGYGCSSSENC